MQWCLPNCFTQSILNGGTVIEPDECCLDIDRSRFEIWTEDLRSGGNERLKASLLEIEARLRRLALSVVSQMTQHKPTALEQQHLSRAEEIARYIAQNYNEPLTVEMIGRHVGLHPNNAMALFQRTFGNTLIKYVTQHRLSQAQRLLVKNNDSILNIATRSGFGR